MIPRLLRGLMMVALGASTARAVCAQAPVPPGPAGVPTEGRPDLRPERVAIEVVGGTYVGIAGYFVGRGIGTLATRMMSEDHDGLREKIVHGTGIVGGAFTVGGFVYAVGDMGSETGSFPTTMLGVGAGVLTSAVLSRALLRRSSLADFKGSTKRKWLMATLAASLPAIGGTIGFNSTRKWQR